jgi:ribosomal protein L32
MKNGAVGDKCACGADDWCITATLIQCRACLKVWGRVNGIWIEDRQMPMTTILWCPNCGQTQIENIACKICGGKVQSSPTYGNVPLHE